MTEDGQQGKAERGGLCGWCGGSFARREPVSWSADVGWQHRRCYEKRGQDWSQIAQPSESEQERRHAAEQARALDYLRSVGKRV